MSTAFDNDPEFGGAIRKPAAGPGPGVRVLRALGCLGVIVLLVMLLLPATRSARGAARRAQCVNNLKQIGLALHNYRTYYGAYPPACTVHADGRRLHSWRVLLLPYMECEELYKTIDLSKPWDDPANAKAMESMPNTFLCPSSKAPRNATTYLANAAEGGFFVPGRPRPIGEIIDGTANTLAVIEADDVHAVPWMAPIDADESLILSLGPDSKLVHPGGMNAAFVDGSVRFLKATTPAETRRALISIAGKEALSTDQD